MMNEDVTFKGLSSNPSDNACSDGELAAVLNLIPEDGELKPIAPPVVSADNVDLDDYDCIVYVHKVTHGAEIHEHYVIRKGDGSYWWCERATEESADQTLVQFALGDIKVNSVAAVGNILCFVCNSKTIYAYWQNSAYKIIDTSKIRLNYSFHCEEQNTVTVAKDVSEALVFTDYFKKDPSDNLNLLAVKADKANALFTDLDALVNSEMAELGDEWMKYTAFATVVLRLYDGSCLCASSIVPLVADKSSKASNSQDYIKITCVIGTVSLPTTIYKYGFSLSTLLRRFSVTLNCDIQEYKDLFDGADVFITASEAFLKTTDQIVLNHRLTSDDFDIPYPYYNDTEFKDKFDALIFYKTLHFTNDELISTTKKTLKGIQGTEEAFSFSGNTGQSVGGDTCLTFNNRLHIGNTRMSAGSAFICLPDNPVPNLASTEEGNYESEAIYKLYDTDGNSICFTQNEKVKYSRTRGDYILSVPNSRFVRLVRYFRNDLAGTYFKKELQLHPSANYNLSYCISWSEGTFSTLYTGNMEIDKTEWDEAYAEAQGESSLSYSYSPSLLKVSEVENPIVFPSANSVSVGSAAIKAMAANTRPITEGQFGDAPLYVFTDEGTWMLMLSSTGTYQTRQPVNREICSNVNGILQTDDAILYPTERGIIMQEGRQAKCITEGLDGKQFDFTNFQNEDTAERILATQNIIPASLKYVRFRKYMDGADMIYDYYDSRIVVFNPHYAYAYVYSLKSGMWGAMDNVFSKRVNTYPESLAVDKGNRIVNVYCNDPTDNVPFFLCTRPVSFGTPNVHKTMFSLIVRGLFQMGNGKCGSVLYGSNDLLHWFPVNTSADRYLRGMAGTPYKSFRLALVGALSPYETLSGFSADCKERWQNKTR